jgi:hypothetical protein
MKLGRAGQVIRRNGLALGVAALATWLMAPVAQAGGVVVSLNEAPQPPAAPGGDWAVSFTLTSMHGTGPVNDAEPVVVFIPPDGGEKLTVPAHRLASPGGYAAEVKLPAAGEWQWEVAPFGLGADYPSSRMTALTVTGDMMAAQSAPAPAVVQPADAAVPAAPAERPLNPAALLLGLVLALGGLSAVVWRRRGEPT